MAGALAIFIEQFDAELIGAGMEKVIEEASAGLGSAIEEGISATDVG